jgi:hypothetical protein
MKRNNGNLDHLRIDLTAAPSLMQSKNRQWSLDLSCDKMKRKNGDLDHLRLDLTATRPIGVEEQGEEGSGEGDRWPAGRVFMASVAVSGSGTFPEGIGGGGAVGMPVIFLGEKERGGTPRAGGKRHGGAPAKRRAAAVWCVRRKRRPGWAEWAVVCSSSGGMERRE